MEIFSSRPQIEILSSQLVSWNWFTKIERDSMTWLNKRGDSKYPCQSARSILNLRPGEPLTSSETGAHDMQRVIHLIHLEPNPIL